MRPIKTKVNIHRLIKSCPQSAWLVFVSQPICRKNINYMYMRVPVLNILMFFGTGTVRLFEASLVDSRQDDHFSMDFLPAIASDHSSMTYKLELLKSH